MDVTTIIALVSLIIAVVSLVLFVLGWFQQRTILIHHGRMVKVLEDQLKILKKELRRQAKKGEPSNWEKQYKEKELQLKKERLGLQKMKSYGKAVEKAIDLIQN